VTTAVDRNFDLFSGNFFRNLHKRLILPDHAQLKAGSLLNGVITLLQVTDLGIEARVSDFQLFGHFLLRLQLTVVFPYLQPAPLSHPKRELEEANDDEKADRQPAHNVLAQVVEGFATRVRSGIAQIFLNANQLVVLGNTVRA